MITLFRAVRMNCKISLKEVAELSYISVQRMHQLELGMYGKGPQEPERFILALEDVIKRKKEILMQAENICMNKRHMLFGDIKESDCDESISRSSELYGRRKIIRQF